MKKLLMPLFGLLLPFAGSGEEIPAAAQRAWVLARFCSEVKYNFFDYRALPFDWDSLCRATLPRAIAAPTDEAFVDTLSRLCASLHDGHTSVFALNNPANPADWVRPLPMRTRRIGDRVFATEVYSRRLRDAGLLPGSELLEIDGEGVIAYGERRIRPLLPSSTPQWSNYAPFGDFRLTKAPGSHRTRLRFRSPDGRIGTLESDRNIPWDARDDAPGTLSFRLLKDNTGLLTIRSFQQGEFRTEEFDRLYEEILRCDALVIDLRGNGGGNSALADYVVSHLIDRPVRLGRWESPMYIAAHGSWGYPAEYYATESAPLRPVEGKPRYDRPAAVLVDATTFSSAENFCIAFRSAARGPIVGTPTGGSTGNPIFVDLGYGVGCTICTKHEWDAAGDEFVGVGIRPDVEAEEEPAHFLKGRDRVLEAALRELRRRSAGRHGRADVADVAEAEE